MARGQKKERPDASKAEIREVMSLVRQYGNIKMRTQYFPVRRPSFMRRLHVSTDDWEKTGTIYYDREHGRKLHEEDQRFIRQYETDMRHLYFIEKGIESIADERTREIGRMSLMDGAKCQSLSKRFKLCISSVYWERDNARRIVAKFIRENRKEYGHESKNC